MKHLLIAALENLAGEGPVQSAAQARLELQLRESDPPAHAALADADKKRIEQPLGFVADAVAAQQIGEIERGLDVPRLQLERLPEEQCRQRPLPLLGQHRAALQEGED